MILENGELKVIVKQASDNLLRFDRTGIVQQVIRKKDGLNYLTKEHLGDETNGGVGICNEFCPTIPIGYSEAKIGEYFLKPGIGCLKKKADQPYNFNNKYELVPEDIEIISGGNWVSYHGRADSRGGYAYAHSKKILLKENRIIIEYMLENTGEKPFYAEEYAHNFFSYNDTDEDNYYLDLEKMEIESFQYSEEKGLSYATWHKRPDRYSYTVYEKNTRSSITESGNFSPVKFKLWKNDHCYCPECFIGITLDVNKSKKWTRQYEFL